MLLFFVVLLLGEVFKLDECVMCLSRFGDFIVAFIIIMAR
jgi:hypothetical protein